MKKTLVIAAILISSLAFGQKKDSIKIEKDTTYILQGKLQDFQLLYLAVTSPGDVTPNQQKAVAAWIEKARLTITDKK